MFLLFQKSRQAVTFLFIPPVRSPTSSTACSKAVTR